MRDRAREIRFQYAYLWGVAPHDPALDELSDYEMELDIDAYLELTQILAGTKKQGPSSEFNERARKRLKKAKEEAKTVTPEELWGSGENAGTPI